MSFIQRNGRWFVIGALVASLAACRAEVPDGPDSPGTSAPAGNVPPATGTSTILDSVEVPTTDEAYEEVRDTIQEENVDAELERLMKEIEEGN